MKIAITSLEVRTSAADKGEYAYGKGSILKKDGTVLENRTIMSFGPQFESVRDILVAGATVEVNAVFDGGTVKVLSPYVAKTQDDAQAA